MQIYLVIQSTFHIRFGLFYPYPKLHFRVLLKYVWFADFTLGMSIWSRIDGTSKKWVFYTPKHEEPIKIGDKSIQLICPWQSCTVAHITNWHRLRSGTRHDGFTLLIDLQNMELFLCNNKGCFSTKTMKKSLVNLLIDSSMVMRCGLDILSGRSLP